MREHLPQWTHLQMAELAHEEMCQADNQQLLRAEGAAHRCPLFCFDRLDLFSVSLSQLNNQNLNYFGFPVAVNEEKADVQSGEALVFHPFRPFHCFINDCDLSLNRTLFCLLSFPSETLLVLTPGAAVNILPDLHPLKTRQVFGRFGRGWTRTHKLP